MLVKQRTMTRHVSIIAVILASAACSDPASPRSAPLDEDLAAMSVQWAGNPEMAQTLAAIRAATAQFHDESVALAAGYGHPPAAFCESSSAGAMGIHQPSFALLGFVPGPIPSGTDPEIDLLRPEVLLYEPQPDGTRKLVGIEYVVYRAAWDAVNDDPPTFLGVPFDERFGSNTHGHAEHYELHVWLWRHNPLGMFAPYNPKVSCP